MLGLTSSEGWCNKGGNQTVLDEEMTHFLSTKMSIFVGHLDQCCSGLSDALACASSSWS